MPVYNWSAWVLYHLPPVFCLPSLPAVSEDAATDRFTATDPVIVAHGQLQVHTLTDPNTVVIDWGQK